MPATVTLLSKFGGRLPAKKADHLVCANEKGDHLLSNQTATSSHGSNGVAQTVPEAFLAPMVQRLSQCASAGPTSAAARDRVPDSRCGLLLQGHAKSRPREVGGEVGCGRARLGLDWCGTLEQPHGRLLPTVGCGRGLRQCRWSRLDRHALPLGLLQPLTKAK